MPSNELEQMEHRRFEGSDFRLSGETYRIRGLRNLYMALGYSENDKYPAARDAFEQLHEYLEYRNESYMAHGLVPITEDKLPSFWKATLEFLDVDEADMPRWPSVRFTL